MKQRINTACAFTLALMLPALPLAWTGCQTVFGATVTVTEIVDAAMKDWAQLSKAGKTNPDLDAKVIAAHTHYREAARVAAISLKAYKESGNETQYVATLNALKAAVGPIIDLITPLLAPTQTAALKTKLTKASQP